MGLKLTDIAVEYRTGVNTRVLALDGAWLEVPEGGLVLVVGATGSGKTTLMRVAAGLLKPDRGTVRVGDTPLPGPAAMDRDLRVGLVFQDPETQLFAETVADDVAFGPGNLRMPDPVARAREALDAVGLAPDVFAGRSPFLLSGGEARRAAIAGVLAMDPAYLLLDEPTAGLDAQGRSAVLGALCTARTRGVGVAVVTHDPEELLGQADSVVILVAGRVTWAGAAAALVEDPAPLSEAGLRAPDLLEVQIEAAERGADLGAHTLDPEELAASVARLAGRGSTRI